MQEAHQPRSGSAEATTNSFKVGDAVTFTVTTRSGNSIRMSVKEAKIVELLKQTAIVKCRNGRTEIVLLSDLTPADQPNALTRALMGDR